VFVLPRSPFDTSRIGSAFKKRSPWRLPFLAAAGTLVVMVAALAGLLPLLSRKPQQPPDIRRHLRAAEEAVAAGRLHRAAEEFAEAQKAAQSRPDVLSSAELRALARRYREVGLLADLLSESLEEILERAAHMPEDEWIAQFNKRYRGPGQANAVVFDAEVRLIGAGQYRLDWELKAGEEPARLEIDDLKLLHDLPLQEPRRLLFGARLAGIRREQNGVWVVRFEPTSGVLLTDPRAVAARYPGPVDEKLKDLLDQQRKWVEGK
jgi:hypothetical protein